MSTNIITIGREPGSGGRLIAARLSEKLGYKVYDKNLLNIASRESGLNREFFEKFDEKASFSIFEAGLVCRTTLLMKCIQVTI